MPKEPMLPHSTDAEEGVLGSILIDPEAFTLAADQLTAEDFYHNKHQVIFHAMSSLHAAHVEIDTLTLCDELERTGRLEDAGGLFDISGLGSAMPTSGNLQYYVDIVARTSTHRRLIRAAGQIAALGYEEDPEALEQAERLIFSIQRKTSVNPFSAMPALMQRYMDRQTYVCEHRGAILGTPTGYRGLDDTLNGLQKSDLIYLAARPSMGKTSLALGIAYNAARKAGKHVVIFSLEMSSDLLTDRLVSMDAHIDQQRLRGGWVDGDEWERIVGTADRLSKLKVFVNDIAGNPVKSMRAQLRRHVQQHGPVDLIVVDYIGLIEPDTEAAARANQVQIVSTISRGLKALAREYDAPVLALAQLSRAVESRQNKRPLLSDLRDSGSLEQDADVVLFIYRDDYYRRLDDPDHFVPDHMAEIIVAKHRNGPTGVTRLFFREEETMFYDLKVVGDDDA